MMQLAIPNKTTAAEFLRAAKSMSLRVVATPRTQHNTQISRGKRISGFAPRHVRAPE